MIDFSKLTLRELQKNYQDIDKIKNPNQALAFYDEIQSRKARGEESITIEEPYEKYRIFWNRFFAGTIDGLIFLSLFFVDTWLWNNFDNPLIILPWFILHQLSFICYTVISHGLYGYTVGKKICGIKVLALSETKLSIKQALLRDAFPIVVIALCLPGEVLKVMNGINPYSPEEITTQAMIATSFGFIWFLTEIITMLSNKKRRALHDYIAGSVVVVSKKS
jgi:uncharacterized RDD family membrane protein YckC